MLKKTDEEEEESACGSLERTKFSSYPNKEKPQYKFNSQGIEHTSAGRYQKQDSQKVILQVQGERDYRE